MSAHEGLAQCLRDAVEAGLRIPCAGRDEWLSEDHEERAQAAQWCDGCPCITECGTAANETKERFGVFGGQDRTPQPKTKEI
ncbi:WhiB family transcriptional regulator [Terrabacter sp. BE26]|uniref:WhiB family transcriptional regulator n=1 Tax=Terrabacter sp. BE26 TaxID=2898152 RepID=UPI0035BE105A